MDFDSLLKFITLTHEFQRTKRSIYATGEDRLEHDAEHSYQLGMVAWYLVSSQKLTLNIDRVIKYALVHDLVEVYAGDTPNFGKGVELKADKSKREEEALEKLQKDFPQATDMFELITRYEKRDDAESRFVYALDKFLSSANIYLDEGRSWFKNNVTLQEMIDNKRHRVIDEHVLVLFDKLVEKARNNEDNLFPKKQ